MYDTNNIFAKILQKKIPSDIIFENEFFFAINDIRPKSDTHILLIPKGKYIDMDDFNKNSSEVEKLHLFRSIQNIVEKFNLDGYRLITNCKKSAGQEVFHLHFHILSGKSLPW
jgi:histidine triad (HIT) family protein